MAAKKQAKREPPRVRDGGTRVEVYNSGLEVWLYDENNLDAIRAAATPADPGAGGMPGGFAASAAKGFVVGYSLLQDDALDVEVHVGRAFSKKELSAGRWLEPQTAFLRLPSGKLCVESNDASRLGPEEPGERGAEVKVPPGDYRLTLYRADHEALDREAIEWKGPQELVLLTPKGKPSDAATELLPFKQRRDTSWVGQHTISGSKAAVLVWLGDYWDTFFVNLDTKACRELGLVPGRHFRTHVPEAGLTLVSVFGSSWDEASKLPRPANIGLEEYGYGAVITPQDWAPHEALFCRREATKTRAEDQVQNLWLPGTIELLDAKAHPPIERQPEARLITLAEQPFFDDRFLAMVLCDLLPGVDEGDELPLADAVGRIDAALAEHGFKPQGDIGWTKTNGAHEEEIGLRLYTGAGDAFAAIMASEANFEFMFLTELADGTWIVTGITDSLQRRAMRRDSKGIPVPHPGIRLTECDEPIAQINAAHRASVGSATAEQAPHDLITAAQAFAKFLKLAEYG